MKEVFDAHQYVLDPHGAVGYLALKQYQKQHPDTLGVILETAHPSKFKTDVDQILDTETDIPDRLAILKNKEKVAIQMANNYTNFQSWLLKNYL